MQITRRDVLAGAAAQGFDVRQAAGTTACDAFSASFVAGHGGLLVVGVAASGSGAAQDNCESTCSAEDTRNSPGASTSTCFATPSSA